MGDIADMLIDQGFEQLADGDDLGYPYEYPYERKRLRCKGCGKKNLEWRRIYNRWTIMEIDGGVHTCHKYSPSIEVLKVLAEEVTKKTKEDVFWNLFEKAKGRGGLTQLINIVSDNDLVDLYTAFVRDDQRYHDDPPIGISLGYKNEILTLKNEILRRMNE